MTYCTPETEQAVGAEVEPLAYYSPETLLFPTLARRFADTGHLTAEELYMILDWKAPRARTKHLKRLAAHGGFELATQKISHMICARPPAQRNVSKR